MHVHVCNTTQVRGSLYWLWCGCSSTCRLAVITCDAHAIQTLPRCNSVHVSTDVVGGASNCQTESFLFDAWVYMFCPCFGCCADKLFCTSAPLMQACVWMRCQCIVLAELWISWLHTHNHLYKLAWLEPNWVSKCAGISRVDACLAHLACAFICMCSTTKSWGVPVIFPRPEEFVDSYRLAVIPHNAMQSKFRVTGDLFLHTSILWNVDKQDVTTTRHQRHA